MTDTHCHILYDVDDGCNNLEESIAILKKMQKLGFKHIILTPHYIDGSDYNITNPEKDEKFLLLKDALIKNNLSLTIHLGNEIFIHNNILTSIKNNKCYALNKGKYLLIELPFHNQIINLDDLLYEIKIQGYIPIIAHPERYSYFQNNYALVDSLKEEGILFQCNYGSILGYYHKEAEKLIKYMLKKEYVEYLGTDIHHIDRSFVLDNFPKIIKQIKKITGLNYFQKIMDNCNALIEE